MGTGSLGSEIIFEECRYGYADGQDHNDEAHKPEGKKYFEDLLQAVNFKISNLRRKISYSVILLNIFQTNFDVTNSRIIRLTRN